MLVVTRKPMQQIRIGNDITVTVVKVERNTVRVAIEAPRDIRILRGELEPFEPTAIPSVSALEMTSNVPADSTILVNATPLRRSKAMRRETRPSVGHDRTAPRAPAHPLRWTIASMRERAEAGDTHRAIPTTPGNPVARANG